jgi:hypothetical protein
MKAAHYAQLLDLRWKQSTSILQNNKNKSMGLLSLKGICSPPCRTLLPEEKNRKQSEQQIGWRGVNKVMTFTPD